MDSICSRIFFLALLAISLNAVGFGEDGKQVEPDKRVILPHQNLVEVFIRGAKSTHLATKDTELVLRNAVYKWNKALRESGTKLRLRVAAIEPKPEAGKTVVLVFFNATNSNFVPKADGRVDLGFTVTYVDPKTDAIETTVLLNDVPVFAKKSGFSVAGRADASRDLEITVLHELGHALGLWHSGDTKIPPIMAEEAPTNETLSLRTRKPVSELRTLTTRDVELLKEALKRRSELDVVGRYKGKLKVSEASGVAKGAKDTLRPVEFEITRDGGDLVLDYHGQEIKAPIINPLLGESRSFKSEDASRPFQSLTVKRGSTDQIEVETLKVKTSRSSMTLKGKLALQR